MDWVKVILGSKRAQATIAAILVALAAKYFPQLGLDEPTASKIVMAISAWILGETYRPTLTKAEA